jgi:hypothetical protein
MRTKIIIIFLLGVLLSASLAQAGDWDMMLTTKTGNTKTYCILGETVQASDGLDSYDICHPPLFPPGRCFIFMQEQSFPNPFKTLWFEYKHYPGLLKVFNVSCYWYPMGDNGQTVYLSWCLSPGYEYRSMLLYPMGLNMLSSSSFSFWMDAFELRQFQVVCSVKK